MIYNDFTLISLKWQHRIIEEKCLWEYHQVPGGQWKIPPCLLFWCLLRELQLTLLWCLYNRIRNVSFYTLRKRSWVARYREEFTNLCAIPPVNKIIFWETEWFNRKCITPETRRCVFETHFWQHSTISP